MKKFINALLMITLLFGFTISAHAIEQEDMPTITITKNLDENGDHADETFNFTITPKAVLEGSASAPPAFADASFGIPLATGAISGSFNLNLPTFNTVGVYEYEIKELDGGTVGMTYDTTPRKLIVLALNDGVRVYYLLDANNKKLQPNWGNTYRVADLNVAKVLAGNFTDPSHVFNITVTLEHADLTAAQAALIMATGHTVALVDGKIILNYTLQGGQNFTIGNIPHGVAFEVEETNAAGFDTPYIATYANEEGVFEANVNTVITNTRDKELDYGVNMDNLPYLLALGFAASGLAYFAFRRKRTH